MQAQICSPINNCFELSLPDGDRCNQCNSGYVLLNYDETLNSGINCWIPVNLIQNCMAQNDQFTCE